MFNRPDYSTIYFPGNLNGAKMNDKISSIILPFDDFFGKVTEREGVLYIDACKIKLKMQIFWAGSKSLATVSEA